jgi:glucosamine-6-phosphate deaminase
MKWTVCAHKRELGEKAAAGGAGLIRQAIAAHGEANTILATGASQFEMLESLVAAPDVDWSRVTAFHLDEYIGIPPDHPASFRKYLRERFVERLPTPLREFHFLDGDTGNPQAECERVGKIIRRSPIDVAFIGIGENGHLAFNDPPADFETEEPFILVELDEACREQQFGEGWFPTFEDVPRTAISMSIRQIMKSVSIICSVPDLRKAEAVKNALEGALSPSVPASILRNHPRATIYLDPDSASKLSHA